MISGQWLVVSRRRRVTEQYLRRRVLPTAHCPLPTATAPHCPLESDTNLVVFIYIYLASKSYPGVIPCITRIQDAS